MKTFIRKIYSTYINKTIYKILNLKKCYIILESDYDDYDELEEWYLLYSKKKCGDLNIKNFNSIVTLKSSSTPIHSFDYRYILKENNSLEIDYINKYLHDFDNYDEDYDSFQRHLGNLR